MKSSFPVPDNESERIEALYSYNILDTAVEKDFDDLTHLASLICGVPIALISLVDNNRQWFKSHKGLSVSQTDKAQSFCAFAIIDPNEILVVEDAHEDPRFKKNPLVTGNLNLTFYAGAPLVNEDGYALGSLCVIDQKKRTLTGEQSGALKILARQVMDKLELRRKNQRLIDSELVNGHLNKQVAESEAALRNLVKQLPVAIATAMGPDHIIELFNDRMLELWDATSAQVLGKPALTAIADTSDPEYPTLLSQVYETGKAVLLKDVPVTLSRNGTPETVWLDTLYEPLRNEADDITGIIMLDTDVTAKVLARREAQLLQDRLMKMHHELKEKERNLRIANEAANLSMWMLDFTTEEVMVSDTFRTLYGFSADEPMNLDKVMKLVVPSFLPQLQQIILDAIVNTRDTIVEYPICHNVTGEQIWMRAVGKVETDEAGNAVRFIGMTADITDQKRREEKIQNLNEELLNINTEMQSVNDDLQSAYDVLQKTNEELEQSHERLLSSSEAMAKLNRQHIAANKMLEEREEVLQFALRSADMALWYADAVTDELTLSEQQRKLHSIPLDKEMPFADAFLLIDEDHRQYVHEAVNRTVKTGEPFSIDYKIHPMDGSMPKWIRSTGILSITNDGNKKTIIGTSVNIDEIKQDELRKSDFISMVSHEMKAPLSTVLGALKLIEMSAPADDPVITEMSQMASGQVRKVTSLINGFLDMSHTEASKIHLEKTTFSIRHLVESLTNEYSVRHPDYHFYFDTCNDLEIVADKNKISSVISNFLSNAVKYSPKNTMVSIICEHNADGSLQVNVTDMGRGISQTDQAKIFDRYYRVNSPRETAVQGFGIGLYLSSEIVKAHQGQIGVESEEDKGSTFWFILPVV